MTELRDSLEAAFDEDQSEEAEEQETEESSVEASLESDEDSTDSDAGSVDDGGAGDADTEESTDAPVEPTTEPAAEPKEAPLKYNAPLGFSPTAKESWKDVPPAVQEAVAKREQDIAQSMQGTADARRTHQELEKINSTYGSIMAAEGVGSPMEAINGLFQTVSELRMGSPAQKAAKLAQMVSHYGVDIGALDAALAGQPVQDNPQDQLSQMVDQRLQPLLDQFQSQQQAQQSQNQQQVNQELENFKQNAEFLDHVRNDMADLIDVSAKHGRSMSFEDAYKRACSLNPEISGIMEQRAAQAKITSAGATLASKRNAASGLPASGSPAAGGAVKPNSLRGEISQLWDSYS